MTIAALVLAVDALTAAFLLGLVHCKDVTRAPGLPRRVPGAALVDNPPPDGTATFVVTLNDRTTRTAVRGSLRPNPDSPIRLLPYVAPSQTIGQRARAQRIDTIEFYRQKYQGAS